ncbi:hypothetical protein M758_1G009100 [Ceratodon purpureus]|uniref:DUF7866 domain-containing protein n=1 Tax=Ceratodon purpureus TaxID=3225 RepID=A0A8T0J3F0_CERPU|nr:hypothetical protein KC19_1G010400 [Ceratodon purpureus]KAG0628210.1 hypothetical protein M758_1G009100 [Ceratodon purpureus]
MPVMGMGHNLQLVLLICTLAGASAILSWEDSQGFKELDEGDSMSLAGDMVRFSNGTELQLFPSAEAHVQEHINGTRRMLGVFRQCSPCTCCDKTRRWCLPTVCCYNIRCGLQGLPYGLCSFIPISCTCFGCRQ